jgi:hypothetical protein
VCIITIGSLGIHFFVGIKRDRDRDRERVPEREAEKKHCMIHVLHTNILQHRIMMLIDL